MKLISEKELRELLIASERLARLDAFGVDNWNWYGDAMCNPEFGKPIYEWEDTDLDDLLKEYKDYEINS